jgi:yeast amino acid transporter
MIYNVIYALGELAVMYDVEGSFYTYATRFIDPSWGFAMGWNYTIQWAIILPLELTVAGLTMNFWNPDISMGGLVTVFLLTIVAINIFGVLGYGEEEFWTAVLKTSTLGIFTVTGILLICGKGPSNGLYSEYWGARTWADGQAFANGIKGFCAVFITAAISFSGTELVGMAAAEAKNPTVSLPRAAKLVFWRITV